MASFKDALKNYKKPEASASEPAPVPLNPPEAVKVMEEQTVPETEGKAEPAPLEVAKPKARAPRGSSKKSVEPTADTASEGTQQPSSPAAPAEPRDDEMSYAIGIIKRGLPAGVTLTITGG